MKKCQVLIALLCCIVLSQNVVAQIPELFIHEWELDHLIIDGQEIFPPSNYEVESVTLLIDEITNDNPDTPYTMIGTVCDSFFASVVFETNTTDEFRLGSDYTETLAGCDMSENLSFQGAYFNFYVQFLEELYEYQITFAEDDSLVLQVFSPNGDTATYNNLTLSVDEVTETSFSVYPNPVQDQLFIESESRIGNYTVVIYDILGKTLLTASNETLNANPVQVSDWTSGMYFLRIEDENGRVTTQRFVKS